MIKANHKGGVVKLDGMLIWLHNSMNYGLGKLDDYKIHCFNGIPKIIQVDFDRFSNHRRNLYDTNWNYIEAEICYPTDKSHMIERPQALDEMLNIAEKLSKGCSYVRVDLYWTGNQVLFGELTFHHGSGCEIIKPESFSYLLGNWIKLPKTTKN